MATCNSIQGSSSKVRVKEEVEFGKSENTGFDSIAFNENGISYSRNQIDSDTIRSTRQPSEPLSGNSEVTGSVVLPVDQDAFGFFLKMLTGNVETTTDFVPGKNLHKFTISDACLPSFQLEHSFTGSDVTYKAIGLKAGSLSLEVGGEGELIGTVDVMGKDQYKTTIQSDAPSGLYSIDYNINTKNITLVDATGFNAGDSVTLKVKVSDVAGDKAAESTTIDVTATEGSNFASEDLIMINDVVYQVATVSGDTIYLNRPLESAVTTGDDIFNVSETNRIASVSGNDIVLESGILQNVIAATDSLEGTSASALITGETFGHFQVNMTSTNGSEVVGKITTMTISLDNQTEGVRFAKDKGLQSEFFEGIANITCDMNILFNAANARVLEAAKIDSEFDVKVEFINKAGERFTINMPVGKINPVTPPVSTPGALFVDVQFKPYITDTTNSIEFELLNTVASY